MTKIAAKKISLPNDLLEPLSGNNLISAKIFERITGDKINSMKDLTKTSLEVIEQLSKTYSDDKEHCDRMIEYMSGREVWCSTPVVSNVPVKTKVYSGAPIACFLSEVNNRNFAEKVAETANITKSGGGLGILLDIPAICENEKTGRNLNYISAVKAMACVMRCNSGLARRSGSLAAYMRDDHPDILDFVTMRKNSRENMDPISHIPSFVHHGVVVSDKLMNAARKNKTWPLIDSRGKEVKTIKARDLMMTILKLRIETGEPFILFKDNANKTLKPFQKKLGLRIQTSNLCTEIVLPTGVDCHGINRTSICCLGSFNISKLWNKSEEYLSQMIEDVMRFYDNILTYFITMTTRYKVGDIFKEPIFPGWLKQHKKTEGEVVKKALLHNHPLGSAIYTAYRGRDIGLGFLGLTDAFIQQDMHIESQEAAKWSENFFGFFHREGQKINKLLGNELGFCEDAKEGGGEDRFSSLFAIAPTSTMSKHCDTTPSIESMELLCLDKSGCGTIPLMHPRVSEIIKEKGLTKIEDTIAAINNKTILSKRQLEIIKSPYDCSQLNNIKLAASRQKYLCQSQSLNFFYYFNEPINNIWRDMSVAHTMGVKTLYYHRSTPAKTASNYKEACRVEVIKTKADYTKEECELCQ